MDTCYTNLANAIIIQTAKDYKKGTAPFEEVSKR